MRGWGVRAVMTGALVSATWASAASVGGRTELAAQSVAATVRGVVREEGRSVPIADAQVQIVERRVRVVSGADGSFELTEVPPGDYTVRVDRLGYRVHTLTVTVGSTDLVLPIELVPEALDLAEIIVSPGHFGVLGEASVRQQQTLTREDLETVPQVGEDVFRILRTVPGVASDDISTRLNLRGGSDVELLTLLDGMELYEPYHLKDFDGIFGVVDVQSIGGIDLVTGGFGAEYGDKLTGVYEMHTATPPASGARTTVGLSVSNASIMSRGGFASGRGRWLVQARRGYLDLLLALTSSSEDDEDISPQYYDVLGKGRFELTDNQMLGLNFLHAGDDLAFREPDGSVDSRWASTYGWLTWEAELGRVGARTMPFAGRLTRRRDGRLEDEGRIGGPSQLLVDDRRDFDFGGLRQDLTIELTPDLLLKTGGEWKSASASYDYLNTSESLVLLPNQTIGTLSDTVDILLERSGHEASAYLAARARLIDRVTAEVGVRYDRISHTDDTDFSPRILAAVELGPRTNVRAGWGRYVQSHGLHELEVGDGEEEFFSSDHARQLAAGIEHRFEDATAVRVEVYNRAMDDQRPRFLNTDREIDAFPEAEGDRVRIDPGKGRARGVEVLVDRDAGGRWGWSANYALSIAEDQVDGTWVPRTLDQRHAFGYTVSFRPDSQWRISGTVQVHSGWPSTPSTFVVDTLPDSTLGIARVIGPLNEQRLPSYQRIDVRVSRNFAVGGGVLQAYLDVFNLLNRQNLRNYAYFPLIVDDQVRNRRVNGDDLLPILPTIGFRWEF